MQKVMQEIKKLSLDEQALIAFDIQKSFADYDEDFTDEEKRELDIAQEELENGTMVTYPIEVVMAEIHKRYGI